MKHFLPHKNGGHSGNVRVQLDSLHINLYILETKMSPDFRMLPGACGGGLIQPSLVDVQRKNLSGMIVFAQIAGLSPT